MKKKVGLALALITGVSTAYAADTWTPVNVSLNQQIIGNTNFTRSLDNVNDNTKYLYTTQGAVKELASNALSTANQVKTTADSALTTANQVKATADTAKKSADTALSTANQVKTTADTAKESADTAIAAIEDVKTTANDAFTTATEVKDTADKALLTADEAKESADTATATVADVKATADNALTAATAVKDTADGAKESADTALITAKSAETSAISADEHALVAQTTANKNTDDIEKIVVNGPQLKYWGKVNFASMEVNDGSKDSDGKFNFKITETKYESQYYPVYHIITDEKIDLDKYYPVLTVTADDYMNGNSKKRIGYTFIPGTETQSLDKGNAVTDFSVEAFYADFDRVNLIALQRINLSSTTPANASFSIMLYPK